MTPYKMQNLVYEWVDFSKFSQNWLKFLKILEKSGDFVQNFSKNRADWYMNGTLFLEKKCIYIDLLLNSSVAHP